MDNVAAIILIAVACTGLLTAVMSNGRQFTALIGAIAFVVAAAGFFTLAIIGGGGSCPT